MNEPVVVVGSGVAGAAACVVLSQAGHEVLLVESGFRRSGLGLTVRIGGLTVAKYRKALRQRAGVTMTGEPDTELYEELSPGGLSNHWSCAVPRFSREDFEDAERAGEAFAWPIGYDDVAPFYDRVEPLLHIAGGVVDTPQLPAGVVSRARELGDVWKRVAEHARRVGRTVAPMPYAYGSGTTVTPSGTAFSAYARLVKPLERSGAISVHYGKRALRLDWSPRTRRVEAVVARDRRSGTDVRIPCRAVVLAAGAVNTPQILLESQSSEFPMGLANHHGVLGRYLHDHPLGKLVIDLDVPIPVHPAVYVTRLSVDRARPLYAAAGMQWSGTGALVRSVLKGRPGYAPWIGFSVFGTMAPSASDGIALDPARPRVDGASAITLHIRHPPEARQVLEETRDALMLLLAEAGFRPRVRVWKVEVACNSVHYAGTCRMHASPRFGMVDRWSRLHGVDNVVVADSSVFTTGPEKNPVLTSMALSARAADRLAEELRSGTL